MHPQRHHTSRIVSTVVAVGTAAAVVASLSGCSALAKLQSIPKQVTYASWADAPHTANPVVSPPKWVPHDATALYVRTLQTGEEPAILTFTSTTPLDSSLCAAGPLTGKPGLDANWWPIGKRPAVGYVCSPGWQVFTKDHATFAWKR